MRKLPANPVKAATETKTEEIKDKFKALKLDLKQD